MKIAEGSAPYNPCPRCGQVSFYIDVTCDWECESTSMLFGAYCSNPSCNSPRDGFKITVGVNISAIKSHVLDSSLSYPPTFESSPL